jgi:hypothetical protein
MNHNESHDDEFIYFIFSLIFQKCEHVTRNILLYILINYTKLGK